MRVGSTRPRRYYCRCGTRLAKDNSGRQCARCERASRDRLISPPEVPAEFWQTVQFEEAFAARHMGRVSRAYRTHPYHYAVYGPYGISRTLLGQWLGLRQTRLADARARSGKQHDLDAAVSLGMVSIDLAERLDSRLGAGPRLGTGSLQDLCLHLTPHRTVPAVREFLEREKVVGVA